MRFPAILVFALAAVLAIGLSANASTLYSNGPINGSIGGINSSTGDNSATADSFTLSSAATVTGFDAGIWVLAGDTPATVNWTILYGGPSWILGTPIASGTATWSNVYWGPCSNCANLYDVYTSTVSGLNVPLGPSNYYWLELSGASSGSGPIGWDENNGPSFAYQNFAGQIGSEAFDEYGFATPSPEPGTILMFGSGLLGAFGLVGRRWS